MANNRYNKPAPAQYQPKQKVEQKEVTLFFSNCLVCGKKITEGYYGSWENGGTCSKTCEQAQELRRPTFIKET
ncbi:MAG: hypothetical protein NTW30_06145 [Candidatus Aenigmarchaeota archaeon]|nr:hypothetical protein [Candidatus Aenigmarchaeota archaeon]